MAKKATNLEQIGDGFEDVMEVLVNSAEESKVLKAMYGSPDKPLKLGEREIACYVLEDGTRVISGRGLQNALGANPKGSGDVLSKALQTKGLSKVIEEKGAGSKIFQKIPFKTIYSSDAAPIAYGYEATVLTDIANIFIEANTRNLLTIKQKTYADYARIILNATSKVGIIGLIDEATGYQEVRARDALQGLLKLYVKTELSEWMKRFPDEYYKHIFRLRGWPYTEVSIKKRPSVIGHWTKDIVYSRIAPGLLEELEKKNPKGQSGRRKNRHHQFLTEDIGHPELAKHLHMVIVLMRASDNWDEFYTLLDKSLPKKIDAKQFLLGFEDIDY